MNPMVILVHGAFAESSSWNDVVTKVTGDGHRVIAFANPLRSLAGDAAGLTELVKAIDGPVVLAGHSYGGAVITKRSGRGGRDRGPRLRRGIRARGGREPRRGVLARAVRNTGRDARDGPPS